MNKLIFVFIYAIISAFILSIGFYYSTERNIKRKRAYFFIPFGAINLATAFIMFVYTISLTQ